MKEALMLEPLTFPIVNKVGAKPKKSWKMISSEQCTLLTQNQQMTPPATHTEKQKQTQETVCMWVGAEW